MVNSTCSRPHQSGPGDSTTYSEMRKVLGIAGKAGPVPLRAAPQITARELGFY